MNTPLRHSSHRLTNIGIVAVLAAALFGFVAPSAGASWQPWPAQVAGVHVVSQTTSSFTVALNRATSASRYRVSASRVEADIWMKNINRRSSHRVIAAASRPRITVGGLAHTSSAYFYRVATINGPHVRWSSTYHVSHLGSPAPTALTARTGRHGTYLTWHSVAATGFVVTQATNRALTAHRRVYTARENTRSFTPLGLTRGHRYWFRVRALNGNTASGRSGLASVVPSTRWRGLRFSTYNTASTTFDGSAKGATFQVSWSRRRAGVVALLRQARSDVITIQEAGAYVGRSHRVRQVDSIRSGLGRAYRIANTNRGHNPGRHQNSPLTGNYLIYKRSRVVPIGADGHWMIGYSRSASYHLFRVAHSNARFLFVGTHLTSVRGRVYDGQRRMQVDNMIKLAHAYASRHGVSSVVYGGDTNAWPGRYVSQDTPGVEMRKHSVSDGFPTAQSRFNAQYRSINSFLRRAPKGGSADRIFVSRGIAVRHWGQLLHLSRGRFVGVIPSDHNPVNTDVELPY